MLKFGGGFVFGFIAGIATLFTLMLVFGDYESEATPSVGTLAAAPVVDVATATVEVASLPAATDTPHPTFTPIPTATPTPLPTHTPVPVVMNQDLTIDGIRWRAIEVQEIGNVLLSDNEWTEDATTDGKFVRVRFQVENRRNEPDGGYEAPDIVDGQGRRFRAFEERFYYLPDDESCSLETFNPNLPRTCMEIYAVAADSTGLYKAVVNNFDFLEPLEAVIELR